jgi:hypothetical protein
LKCHGAEDFVRLDMAERFWGIVSRIRLLTHCRASGGKIRQSKIRRARTFLGASGKRQYSHGRHPAADSCVTHCPSSSRLDSLNPPRRLGRSSSPQNYGYQHFAELRLNIVEPRRSPRRPERIFEAWLANDGNPA